MRSVGVYLGDGGPLAAPSGAKTSSESAGINRTRRRHRKLSIAMFTELFARFFTTWPPAPQCTASASATPLTLRKARQANAATDLVPTATRPGVSTEPQVSPASSGNDR